MRALKSVLLGLLVLTSGSLINLVNAADDVLTPLKSIYSADAMREQEPFSKQLQALYDAAIKRSQELEAPVAGLDFDYATNAQDFEEGLFETVAYDVKSETAEAANVIVTFKNFEPQTLSYTLVNEDGKWLIDDVKCMSQDCDWQLSELFKEGAATQE